MAKLSQLKTDKKKEIEGVLIDYDLDVKLLVASVNNPKYKEHRTELLRPYMQAIRSGKDDVDVVEHIKPAIARHLLIGWQNITDDKGRTIEYSEKAALELLNELPDMVNLILAAASNKDQYRLQVQKESEKN